MRAVKRPSRGDRTRPVPGPGASIPGPIRTDDELDPAFGPDNDAGAIADEIFDTFDELHDSQPTDDPDHADEESYEIFRVHCPDCSRPIALLADEDVLPEHALCPTPWNPFVLTVCSGSGRAVAEADPVPGDRDTEQDVAALLTLPAGFDWRTQPFSHAGSVHARPIRVAALRAAAG